MQTSLFTGAELRDKGMQRATDHANAVHGDWSEKAYHFFKWFITQHIGEFMVEDVRRAARSFVPEPPHLRAWGSVVVRAVKAGLIKRKGIRSVKNAKAHKANASVWIKL